MEVSSQNFEKKPSQKRKQTFIQIFQVNPAFQLLKMFYGDKSIYFWTTEHHAKLTIRILLSILMQIY